MSKKLNINQTLIVNFLGRCKEGIIITQDASNKAKSMSIMNEVSFCYDKDKLGIFNEEKGFSIEISRLNEWTVKEYDDYITISKDDFKVKIEEMF